MAGFGFRFRQNGLAHGLHQPLDTGRFLGKFLGMCQRPRRRFDKPMLLMAFNSSGPFIAILCSLGDRGVVPAGSSDHNEKSAHQYCAYFE